jgi:hypothetical protein
VLADHVLHRALAAAACRRKCTPRAVVDDRLSRIVPAFATTQAACWRTVASTSKSVKLASCVHAVRFSATRTARASAVARMRAEGARRDRARHAHSRQCSTKRSSYGVFVGVFPMTTTAEGRIDARAHEDVALARVALA